MLASRNRFHGHGSLRYVYAKGQVARSKLFIVKYSENPRRRQPRVAIVVSKKVVKSAVKRNRIRRRLYEIIRVELPKITNKCDIVIIVTSVEMLVVTHEELVATVKQTITRANLYNTPEN